MKQNVLEGEKHFCASVWITTTSKPQKILLVYHKKLGRWLQPGGHIEKLETPVEAAIREIKEETGIDVSFLRKQETNSAVIVSFGVMDELVLATGIHHNKIPQGIKYMQELSEEIKRVSSPFAIIVGHRCTTYLGNADIYNIDWHGFGGVYSFNK